MLLRLQRVPPDLHPVHGGGSAGRTDEVQEQVDRRGLPGAVGTEKAEDLPFRNREVQVVEGEEPVLVALGQIGGLKH